MNYGAWLAQATGLTGPKLHYLYSRFSDAEEVYRAPREQILTLEGLNEEEKNSLLGYRQRVSVEESNLRLASMGIDFVCIEDANYPNRLKNIHNPPYGLFYRGKLPDETKRSVAIVGARGRSAYGEQVARKLSKTLAEHDVSIISGLAIGIDGDAHKGALEGGGRTYGVLAGGVETCYPASHRFLYDKILDQGGVLSEYAPGTEPLSFMFPMRNRIISGLADCVIVIEAREKSGSLITADFAMEQGRDVYALPGRISDPLSRGCNCLIKQGAGVICSIEDFLQEWNLMCDRAPIQMDFRKNLLEKEEALVYSLLDFCPMGIGTLMEKVPYDLIQLIDILERLEKKEMIRETIPNYFIKTL